MNRRAIFAVFLVCIAAPACAADQKAKPGNDDDPIGRKLSERIGPFVQTGMFDRTNDEPITEWRKKYERLTVDEKVHYCIYQLRNESWYDWSSVWSDQPYSKKPEATASQELVKLGRAAIPQLLAALNSHVSTKIHPSRHFRDPWLVRDAAMDAIEHIACRRFGRSMGLFKLKDEGEVVHEIRNNVAAWWDRNKGSVEVQWAKDALVSGTTTWAGERYMAIDSLYRRLGKESYPLLAEAYHRLPKGRKDCNLSLRRDHGRQRADSPEAIGISDGQ